MKKVVNKVSRKYYGMIGALHASLLLTPGLANAGVTSLGKNSKSSDIAKNLKNELEQWMPIIMLFFGAVGVIITGTAIKSIIDAKKNRERLTWEVWGVLGGAALTIIVLIVYAIGGSIGSDGKALGDLKL